MRKYSGNKAYTLYHGNMLDILDVIPANSIDSIITDPPYELNFMNKGWDNSGIAFQAETWRKCYEVLKSGGYLLAFGGSRTFHRIACAIEDAGFEIRDTIMWLYGSGFPKSMNIGLAIDKKNGVDNRTGKIRTDGKASNSGSGCYNCNTDGENSMQASFEERIAQNEWTGWGTALKPAYEPVIVARKPCENSCIDNVLKYGVGGINIDECRVGDREDTGRFPANVILTYDDSDFEEVCGGMPETKTGAISTGNPNSKGIWGSGEKFIPNRQQTGDEGSAARYFYCAKASKKDRDEGLEEFEDKVYGMSGGSQSAIKKGETYCKDGIGLNQTKIRKNTHPTVKPCSLMQYLVRLVSPKGATILDVFNGSGSTGKAVMYENRERNAGYKYIGIELTEEYLPIADARIRYAAGGDVEAEDEQEQTQPQDDNQMSVFDLLDKEAGNENYR